MKQPFKQKTEVKENRTTETNILDKPKISCHRNLMPQKFHAIEISCHRNLMPQKSHATEISETRVLHIFQQYTEQFIWFYVSSMIRSLLNNENTCNSTSCFWGENTLKRYANVLI
jgi:hypothetical protein